MCYCISALASVWWHHITLVILYRVIVDAQFTCCCILCDNVILYTLRDEPSHYLWLRFVYIPILLTPYLKRRAKGDSWTVIWLRFICDVRVTVNAWIARWCSMCKCGVRVLSKHTARPACHLWKDLIDSLRRIDSSCDSITTSANYAAFISCNKLT